MADNIRHPGITMHKLPVGGGFAGLVFAAGSAVIFLLGLPSLWYFVAFSAALGVGIAAMFRLVSDGRSERSKPLSILSVSDTDKSSLPATQKRTPNLRDRLQGTFPAPVPAAAQHP